MSDQLKVTVDQLKNYINTGLYCKLDYGVDSYFDKLIGITESGDLLFQEDQGDTHNVESIKPECYKLSDLDKFIPELGIEPMSKLAEIEYSRNPEGFKYPSDAYVWLNLMYSDSDYTGFSYWMLEKLFQWHFWPFDQEYFEQGLVIDKHF